MNFSIGDIVSYKGEDSFWKKGEIHIIYEACYLGNGELDFSTNKGAWFSQNDFDLVEKASKKSFKQLDKDMELGKYAG